MLWFKLIYCSFLILIICFACMDYNFSMKGEKCKFKVWGVLLLVFFSIIISLRPMEMKDTYNYVDCFVNSKKYLSEMDNMNLLGKCHGFECGYMLLNAVFYNVFPDYRYFFFVITLFSSYFSIKNIEEIRLNAFPDSDEHWFLTMAIYITGYALSYFGVALRAGLAITLALIAYKYFCKRKYLLSLFFLILGCSMQRSIVCVTVLMILGMLRVKIKKKTFLGVYVVLLFMLVLNVGSLVYLYIVEPALNLFQKFGISGYSAYLLVGVDQQVGLTDIWVCLAGFIVCLLCTKREERYFGTLYFSFLIVAIIIVFLHGARAIARLYEIFLFFTIPIYVEEFYDLKRKLGMWGFLVLLVGNFLVSIKTVFG